MEEVITNRDKVVYKKFLSAENERKCKSEIRTQLQKQKLNSSLQIDLNSKKFYDIQNRAMEEYTKRENLKLLKRVQEKSMKLHENIIMHRKVIKQLLEQESKFIRKPKKPKAKVDRMPYLRNVQSKLIQSVQITDTEKDDIEMALPNSYFLNNYRALKIKPTISSSIAKSILHLH